MNNRSLGKAIVTKLCNVLLRHDPQKSKSKQPETNQPEQKKMDLVVMFLTRSRVHSKLYNSTVSHSIVGPSLGFIHSNGSAHTKHY